ncbi:MAG: hypothetical protein LBL62_04600 [Planctomycetaceae bacterium]|nr:hypothetical protein [Planctomycetaceae bacterium]
MNIEKYLNKKLEAAACYQSQLQPFPDARSLEALKSLATWRESQVSMNAAERFILVREFI